MTKEPPVFRLIAFGSPEYRRELALRNEVLRRPLGLVLSAADTEDEENQIHIGLFKDNELAGCVILAKTAEPHTARLRQLAVYEKFKGGTGKALVLFFEKYAARQGYTKIIFHARTAVREFYEKLGFHVKGNEFIEKTIPHIEMEKELASFLPRGI